MRLRQTNQAWGSIINKFNGGVSTLLDAARVGLNQAVDATNLMQEQDGIWTTRWGTEFYGQPIPGESSILAIAEYLKSNNTRELIAIGATTGKIYKSVDNADSWSQIGSIVFSTSAKFSFIQIDSYLYIANGIDSLTRYNGTTITQYSSIATPTLNALTRGAGLSAGSITYYYKVTALNAVGETIGSNEQSITVNKDRSTWTLATENIGLTWNVIAGATRYQVYFSEETNRETLIADVATNAYTDTGADVANPYVVVPQDNTTGAPLFSEMAIIGNRIWGTKDSVNPYRVHWSGDGLNLGAFSAYYRGGWIDLEKGGREKPVFVGNYRTGKGDNATTVLCSSPEGVGSVWQISLDEFTVGSLTFIAPAAQKIVGTIGTNSPKAVVSAMDSLIFANKRAVYSLGNKQQIFNVLATDEMSANIRPSYRNLDLSKLSNMCAYWYDSKIFFSATEKGIANNNIIFVFDTERRNWSWKWTIGVNQFLEYTDTSNNTYLLGVQAGNSRLIRFNPNVYSDLGQAFATSYISGLIPISDNVKFFAKVNDVIVQLGRPQGEIKFEIFGLQKKKGFAGLASKTIVTETSSNYYSYTGYSKQKYSYSDSVAKIFSDISTKKRVRVKKLLSAIQYRVYSNSLNTKYSILSIQADGNLIPTRIPSSWKK